MCVCGGGGGANRHRSGPHVIVFQGEGGRVNVI